MPRASSVQCRLSSVSRTTKSKPAAESTGTASSSIIIFDFWFPLIGFTNSIHLAGFADGDGKLQAYASDATQSFPPAAEEGGDEEAVAEERERDEDEDEDEEDAFAGGCTV